MDKVKTETEEKKEFLQSYLHYSGQETEILESIQQLRLDKVCPSTIYDGMPHGNQKTDLSDYAVLFDEKKQKLINVRDKKDKAYRMILSGIKQMDERDEQFLLRLLYVQGLDMHDTAVVMGYKRTKIYDLYNSAIDNFKLN